MRSYLRFTEVPYVGSGEEMSRAAVVSLQRDDHCPRMMLHAPMPAAYGAWCAIADRRERARQVQEKCRWCDRYTIWRGGREVPGWPRRMSTVNRERARLAQS